MRIRYPFFLILLFISCINLFAQKKCVIHGHVYDSEGKPIPNVAVLVKLDRVIGAATNNDGYYQFSFFSLDSVNVSYSNASFEPQVLRFAPQDTITADVVLSDKTNSLAEVVVKGEVVRVSDNSIVYLPTQQQKNSSNSGISLLYNIMLPELNVNPFTNSVSSTDGSSLSMYIDGRKSNIGEVKSLRPKDIIRVEVYDGNMEKFPNEQKVVNFILRHYDYGGYVDVRTDNRFFYNTHDQSVQLSLDSKKWNYTIMGEIANNRDNGIKSNGVEHLLIDKPIERKTNITGGKSGGDSYSGVFKTLYKSQNTMFYAQMGMKYSKDFSKESSEIVYMADGLYDSRALQNLHTKDISPTLNMFLRKDINKNHSIEAKLTCSYLNRTYDRAYVENDFNLCNDIREHAYKFDGNLKWNYRINRNNSFSVFLWDVYSRNKNYYYSNRENDQQLVSNDFLLYPTYTYIQNGKFYLSCQAGFDVCHNEINKYRYSKVYPRPALTVNYYISKTNSLFMDVRMGSTIPMLSRMNSAEQQINTLQVVRGNPYLQSMKILDGLLSYNIHTGNFRMSAFFSYNALYDLSKNNYVTDAGKLVQTYISDGNFNDCKFGVNSVVSCLGRNFQIRCSLAYQRQSVTGKDKDHIDNFIYNVNVLYHLKNFAFSAYYNSKSKMLSSTPMIMESLPDYGLLATWGYKGLFLEIGAKRIFEKNSGICRYYSYDRYNTFTRSYSDAQDRQVYVKLSYSFDFGRKISHKKIESNNSVNSSIIL